MLKFLKSWMLPIAMLIGVLTYQFIGYISFITPYLISVMLLFTFCRISPRDIYIYPAHIWLIMVQIIGSLTLYGIIWFVNPIIAQGAFICILAPTAASGAAVTGMLGGNVGFHTSYLLLCNILVAIMGPLLFPLIGPHHDVPFVESFFYICRQIGPILLLPLGVSWFIRYYVPKAQKLLMSAPNMPFYIWATALIIVTGNTVKFLVEQENPNYSIEIGLAAVSLLICGAQFLIGRAIGRRYDDVVASGQSLGQKNTILAIWMAQAYLSPISSIAPAAYVLWQNIVNSYQLWLRNKQLTKQLNTNQHEIK